MMYGTTSIEGLLLTGAATIEQMNGTLPVIPFPFAGAYMASLMLLPAGMVDPAFIAMVSNRIFGIAWDRCDYGSCEYEGAPTRRKPRA